MNVTHGHALAARCQGVDRLDVIDSHTCGQPTRVVFEGSGLPPGMSPREAQALLASQRDWVRKLAVLEPRGHRSMFAVAVIAPVERDGIYGLVYMDANGYPDMCGHATIGAATTLFEAGLLRPPGDDFSGQHEFQLTVPMGLLHLRARFEKGRCVAVAFRTPLAYYLGSLDLALEDGQTWPVDIAYGGQWYAYVPVEASGLDVKTSDIDGLIAAAAEVRKSLAGQLALVDPRTGTVPDVGNIVWTAEPLGEKANARNVPVSSAGSFDRSPCGTATCARMATLAAKGHLVAGEAFVNQGLVGTLYTGALVARIDGDGVEGYVPEVEGSAWLTASSVLWRDPADPLGEGFLV